MIDEDFKDFFTDHQTNSVLERSEVWNNYSKAELIRDQIREKKALEQKLDEENYIMESLNNFRKQVEASPKLKNELKKAVAVLKEYPELREKVDPTFLNGLVMLDLED